MTETAIDLFAGAGGATLGLKNAGKITLGVDSWLPAVETHIANGMDCMQADVSAINPSPFDIVWASPPCQPWSQAGSQKGSFDTRDCMPQTMRYIANTRPRLAVIENVKTLSWKKNEDYLSSILSILPAEYNVEWRVLDFSKHGVPQSRKRWICIVSQGKINWPEEQTQETMASAIGWDKEEAQSRSIHDDDVSWVFERPAMTVVGSFQPEVMAGPGYRKAGDGPRQRAPRSVKITQGEAATLQGFPKDFAFTGNNSQRWTQIGNAVPPVVAQRLVEANP
jgi:DNA (cytosine-5)-methyltransferase 1